MNIFGEVMGVFVGAFGSLLLLAFIQSSLLITCTGADSNPIRCISIEKEALLQFKESLTGLSSQLSSWVGKDCCSWVGVSCSNITAHVLKLDLHNSVPCDIDPTGQSCLGGEINQSLLGLSHLSYLDLSNNNFSGAEIPSFLGSLRNLEYLNLSNTLLEGRIPQQLGNLSNLRFLDLGGSYKLSIDSLYFVSTLPLLEFLDLSELRIVNSQSWLQSINMLPSLIHLSLDDCGLSHMPILVSVNFTSLAFLNLGDNNFNSAIPSWMSNISNSIEYLDLHYDALRGSIPTEIGSLKLLRILDLSFNELEGRVPETLRDLCNLEELYLRVNKLTGDISGSFGNRSGCIKQSLKVLDLCYNGLEGEMPHELGEFKNVEDLHLSSNSFHGPIPESIGGMSSLRELYLFGNKLNGSIPKSLGQLSNLKHLHVRNNSLSGVVSELHFSKLADLVDLQLGLNSLIFHADPKWIPAFQLLVVDLISCNVGPQFPQWLKTQASILSLAMPNASISGSIPYWFEEISVTIGYLDLSYNQITGSLPRMKALVYTYPYRLISLKSNKLEGPLIPFPSDTNVLDLSDNLLGGHIPPSIGNLMPELASLSVSSNMLHGEMPPSLCQMRYLYILDLSKNLLSGRLLECWSNFQNLEVLDLGNNNLSGDIPLSFGSLKKLKSLHIQSNTLQGNIPISLSALHGLTILHVGDNLFAGFIPKWIGENLTALGVLDIHSNMFEGEVPHQLCNLKHLRVLNLASNDLIGELPACLGNLTSMQVSNNKAVDDFWEKFDSIDYDPFQVLSPLMYKEKLLAIIKGAEREYTSTLQFLFSMDLSENGFTGRIPKELMSLSKLQNLNLSGNKFVGEITSNIGNLKWLESLDLSRNKLSGTIPPSIAQLNYLNHLNLSFNKLSGPIPTGNQIQTLNDKSIYLGNIYLCGSPLRSCEELSESEPQGDSKSRLKDVSIWFFCGLMNGFTIAFVGVCVLLHYKQSWMLRVMRTIKTRRRQV
ncbi:hypothetical protein K2173_009746 [Erythroxylum novogranatense]|uniref:Leucine-rich repeat-containing N-terminal plant-type domain-containing protein n=1 Tax=Erythroxylum novogranatense TaxID=1862640 RepID=A0AAV8TST5_9ROSI|nr:hypothetical protein K2173_009746 [Erythroxylum novogranatense]